jgi:hypothetical protein
LPVHTALWKVGQEPVRLTGASLSSEKLLETMILASPQLLSDEWMLIGQQADTGSGGRVDLLAIAPDASLVLIELKRDRTPRDVVAQALDYAGWIESLESQDIDQIYSKFRPGRSLASDFKERYGRELIDEELNQTHQIIVVASALDESTERIIGYLNAREVPINVLFFQVFAFGAEQILSRSWLLDPVKTQANAAVSSSGPNEPWNGEFYGSFGADENRSWEDAVKYGFFSAGGGAWYSRTLQLLNTGNRLSVKIPGRGFVGVGLVTGRVQPANQFQVDTTDGLKPILEAPRSARYIEQFKDDLDMCEYFVPVKWLQTVTLERAVYEVGLFGNQNSVCQPTTPKWRSTVERLKSLFPKYDEHTR